MITTGGPEGMIEVLDTGFNPTLIPRPRLQRPPRCGRWALQPSAGRAPVLGLTRNSRATSAWLAPWANRSAAASRTCSRCTCSAGVNPPPVAYLVPADYPPSRVAVTRLIDPTH